MYTSGVYKFRVGYPANFVFRPQPAGQLAQFNPQPDASFRIMDPLTAANDQDGLEPADLTIRIFSTGLATSLDSWLIANHLLPADGSMQPKPFKTDNVSGFEVCPSSMIAPGCSYFFTGNALIYQLTPATQAGQTMIKTFILIP